MNDTGETGGASDVDALSLQIFANLFASVAEEMGVALLRAAYSPNIKERKDYSCAIFDAAGRLLAQAAHIPVHLGAMPLAMETVLDRFTLEPGDVVIMNDPFAGGTHLPDISLVSAAFTADHELIGYVMSRAHHSDVGGMSPGSMPLSTDIYQEGIVIPPLLLRRHGSVNQPLLDLLLRNVRTPRERKGDLAAQQASQNAGERGLQLLAARYGLAMLSSHGAALQSYSEGMMRRLIGGIRPGQYKFRDYLDNDGFTSETVEIAVTVSREAGETDLQVDFTGSAPQCVGPVNAVRAVTLSATLYVLCCLVAEDIPVNQGSLRPLRVTLPSGTVVAALPPAPIAAGNVETSQRIVDVLFGALARALPGRVPAASQGTMNNITMGGFDRRRSSPFAYYETMGGGMGGRPGTSGASGVHDHMSNTLNTPIEVLEATYPLRVRRYEIRRGTGGSGEFPGGEGLRRDLEFLEETDVTVLMERQHGVPYGLHGGGTGGAGECVLLKGETETVLAGKSHFSAGRGEILSLRSPGGGGLGRLPRQS